MKKKILVLTLMLLCCFTFMLTGCAGGQTTYTISVTSTSNNCTVYGSGEYIEGKYCTIAVVPNEGYEFVEWNDGNKNAIRKVQVTSNKTYSATVKTADVTYVLDKVELYAEECGNLTARGVELSYLNIYDDDYKLISECNVFGYYVSYYTGANLITSNSADSITIKANEDNPFIFYSSRTDKNMFISNVEKEIIITGSIFCDNLYWDDDAFAFDESMEAHNYYPEKKLNVSVNSSSLTQKFCIYTDSTHGYKIMVKLNFVEI